MTSSNPPEGKHLENSSSRWRFLRFVALGVLLIGIVCIGWALVSIGIQSKQIADSAQNAPSNSATLMLQQIGSTEVDDAGTDKVLYPQYPNAGDVIGTLSLPTLEQVLPIIEGTDDEELERGVGHYIQSVLPGEKDNCVLSGHRDTVFSELGELEVHDRVVVETSAGIYTYEVKNIRIVGSDDRTVIVPTDHAVLTLTTCYPFDFIGDAPDRYIVSADLVEAR